MKKEIKYSLITTVKNEEKHIEEFLSSLALQTMYPDEIIIVDGGSTDKTVKYLNTFKSWYDKKGNIKVKIFIKPGFNISKGRNFAIEQATGKYIFSVDAGCVVDNMWFEHMSEQWRKGNNFVDIVSGVYKCKGRTLFQKIVGEFVCKKIDKLNDNFLPSSRSVAFKKSCWKHVGGYPEDLYTGEDTAFDLELKKLNFKFYLEKRAYVSWYMRGNLRTFWKQFYLYGKGDKDAGNLDKMKINEFVIYGFPTYSFLTILALVFFPSIGYIWLSFIPAYGLYNGIRMFIKYRNVKSFIYGFEISIVKRIAYIMGALFG